MPVTVINNVAYIQCGRKPNNKQLAQAMMKRKSIARCIMIPLDEGPHQTDGIWCFNCTLWNFDTTEERSLAFLLSQNITALHDVLLQHISHWSELFKQWFSNNFTLLPIKYSIGDIIFDHIDQIYIKVTYIANNQYRMCYSTNTYYKQHSCLYGGNPVNIKDMRYFVTLDVSRKIIYVSNESELVSPSADDDHHKIMKLQRHQSYISTINDLYFHTKQIKSYHLRLNVYGQEKKLKPKKK
eukprot:83709_1